MIGTNDRPLEKTPHALYRVGVDIPANPLLLAVIDRFVLGISIAYTSIRRPDSYPRTQTNILTKLQFKITDF